MLGEHGLQKVHRLVISIDTLFEMECIFKIWKINHISPKSLKRLIYTNYDHTKFTNVIVKHLVHGDTCFSEADICIFWNFKKKADSGIQQTVAFYLSSQNKYSDPKGLPLIKAYFPSDPADHQKASFRASRNRSL